MSKDTAIQKKGEVISLLSEYAKNTEELYPGRSDCKVCNSKYRAEIEEKYTETNSYKAAFRIVKGIEDISYHAIRRHIDNHLVAHERALLVKEYSENVDKLVKMDFNRRNQLVERVAILHRKLFLIEALSENLDIDQMLKCADTVKKLSDSILTHEKEVAAIDQKMEPVIILVNNFKNTINKKMTEAPSNEVKQALYDLLDEIIKSSEHILVEK